MRTQTRLILVLLISAGAVFQAGCKDSPVDDAETVYIRGSVDSEIKLVKMVDVYGVSDRTASVNESGRYEFAWTGVDLRGFLGERWFNLLAPATATYDQARTTSEMFHHRFDMEAPYLRLWDAQVELAVTPEGGLEVSFALAEGDGFQEIENYRLVLRYSTLYVDENGGTSIVTETVEATIPASGKFFSAQELRNLLPERINSKVSVAVEAQGTGEPLSLTYHSPDSDIILPLSQER